MDIPTQPEMKCAQMILECYGIKPERSAVPALDKGFSSGMASVLSLFASSDEPEHLGLGSAFSGKAR